MPFENPGPAELARRWRQFTEPALRDGDRREASSYFRIRYEDLAREPGTVMPEVFAFLGEAFDPAVLDDPERRRSTVPPVDHGWLGKVIGPITPPDEGAWRRDLSRLGQLRVAPIVAPFLRGLGYEPAAPKDVAIGRAINTLAAPFESGRAVVMRVKRRLGRDSL
jgi:hypothetical protein